jgi:hypothetical protein
MSIYDGTYGDDEAIHPETKENHSSSYFVDTASVHACAYVSFSV